jgi:hypothetical protein
MAGRGDNDSGVHWMDGHGSNYRSPLPIPHFSTPAHFKINLTLSAHFLFQQQLPRVVLGHIISQLHFPCPLYLQKPKTKTKKITYIKFLLSRGEKKKAFPKEGRREGSK